MMCTKNIFRKDFIKKNGGATVDGVPIANLKFSNKVHAGQRPVHLVS